MKRNDKKSLLVGLYETMLRIRLCEESFVELILDGRVRCPVHLYTGEEAVAAGVCAALQRKDLVFGTHRSHGHYLAKGGSMRALVAEICGKQDGCCRGRSGSMHVVSAEHGVLGVAPIVAGTVSLAVGAALAVQMRDENAVVVSFFGDGATGEGVLAEAMNFAALHRLPVIFACENNLYSTHLRIDECRPPVSISELSSSYGFPGSQIDGNDVLKVYELAEEAVSACRNGKGPAFIEFLTYRQRGHVGPDDNVQGMHTDIRISEEVASWKMKDPIVRLESLLLRDGILTNREAKALREKVCAEVDEAHEFARQSKYPPKEEVLKYVFK